MHSAKLLTKIALFSDFSTHILCGAQCSLSAHSKLIVWLSTCLGSLGVSMLVLRFLPLEAPLEFTTSEKLKFLYTSYSMLKNLFYEFWILI